MNRPQIEINSARCVSVYLNALVSSEDKQTQALVLVTTRDAPIIGR